MKKTYIVKDFPHMLHGGDYNPDQWTDYPEVLEEDMRLMQKANCNEMTVGIFAWSTLEPKEGVYDFSFMQKALDDIYEAGGRVILATPSGARPKWLSDKYPEVLRTDSNGVHHLYGARHNHCLTSPVYREKVATIDREISKRFGNHPAVIGWHISNEFSGECFCPLCQEAFRKFLKEKYKTIENLNEQWWTKFWSHTYDSFEQIEAPMNIGEGGLHGLVLEWKRFINHQTIDFMKAEMAAVREFSTAPITTNLMGILPDLDYSEFAEEMDFISNDIYPTWKGGEADITIAMQAAMTHDYMRSLKHQPFLIMECTPSHVNWHNINTLKRPKQNEVAGLQAISHGSDSVLYFQWRKSRGSSEKFHGAVVDHVGHENTRVFREVSALGARLKKLDEIVGTHTDSKIAILYDWSNRTALDRAQGFQNSNKKYLPTLEAFYKPLWEKGINTDIISLKDDFSKYSVIFAPMLYSVSEENTEKLAKYVENGGKLVCTYMTGMVNENDLCYLGGFPGGALRKVLGIWNEEIDTLYPEARNTVSTNSGETFTAVDYCELIHTETATAFAKYDTDFYKDYPAATVNSYGKGEAYYLAFRDTGDFTEKIVTELLEKCNIKSDFDGELPLGVAAPSRTDGENVYVFLQNFSLEPKTVTTNLNWTNVETGEKVQGEIILNKYDTIILKR